jgi:propionaldehyde dehydrogenase
MNIDEAKIERIVGEVVRRVQELQEQQRKPSASGAPQAAGATKGPGIFETVDEAVAAARQAFTALGEMGLAGREKAVAGIRSAGRASAQETARLAVEETGMGRFEHKVIKNEAASDLTPGAELLATETLSGDKGVMLTERTPFGVILAITPSTNPTSTVISNAIAMVAAGNAVVFSPHPGAARCTIRQIEVLNNAIVGAGGPASLLTTVSEPSLRVVVEAMKHPGIDLICATGGAAVVRAALESGKKTVAAGPGNPPVIVDETADLERAARHIVEGAAFDNNIVCVCEKEIIALDRIADDLKREILRRGVVEVSAGDLPAVTRLLFGEDGQLNRALVGRDAPVILRQAGIAADNQVRLALAETDESHPLVQHEQLAPIIPFLRTRTFDEAVALAIRAEQGFRHTAVIHSRDIERITKFGRAIRSTVFVANAPSYAWTGLEGEGYVSMTIAGATGEGLTDCRTFTRRRHSVLSGHLRMA